MMMIQIKQEDCAGCGICEELCPRGAITLVDGMAVIDQQRCTQCEACIEACPNSAISALAAPVQAISTYASARSATIEQASAPGVSIITRPKPVPVVLPLRQGAVAPQTSAPERSLAVRAGAVLVALGNQFGTRLIDLLIGELERRLERLDANAAGLQAYPVRNPAAQRSGRHRQLQMRRSNCSTGNQKGRR